MLKDTLKENIKRIRKSNHISQRELARKIDMSGQMISKIERGETTPSMETLNKIAKALNTNVYNLIGEYITLTGRLIKLFEETVCKYSRDAENTLELICEMIDIDEEVINRAVENDEDISESYLVSMLDLIFKDSPGAFEKFYKENKYFISSGYDMAQKKCSELELKYAQYISFVSKLNVIYPENNRISNLYQKTLNNTLTYEDVKDIEDYKQLELMNNSDAFGGLQNYTDKDYGAFKEFRELMKRLDYSDDDINNYSDDIFPKIKVQIEKEILYLKNKDTPQHE